MLKTNLSVVIAGHVCIDHNRSEHATYTNWGSASLYMAQVFARLYEADVRVLTSYGPDLLPYLPAVQLIPEEPSQTRTMKYTNITNSQDGIRVQYCFNTRMAKPTALTAESRLLLSAADIVAVAVLLPNYSVEYVQQLLAPTAPSALKVLCPQGYFRRIGEHGLVQPRQFIEAESIIKLFDLVVYSEEDYPQAFLSAHNWKRHSPDTHLVITQGGQGASIVKTAGVNHVPTKPIAPANILDSVGCGDTFAAALAANYYASKDIVGAIKKAHRVAAHKLMAAGDIF